MDEVSGLSVSGLTITARFKNGKAETIVKDLRFGISKGRKLALVGASGCGKTMTAMAVLGLLPANCHASGTVRWADKDLLALTGKERRALLGRDHVLIPQSGADFLNPALTVRRQMEKSLQRLGVPRRERYDVLCALLLKVGLTQPDRVLKSYPFQLSGGMAQRVVMAAASAGAPGLVVADEPTRGIDMESIGMFLRNMDALFGYAAVLLITHDISVAAACDDIVVIKGGEIVEQGQARKVLGQPAHQYTKSLLSALPGGWRAENA